MSRLMYCAGFLGIAVASELILSLYKTYKRNYSGYINELITFDDKCYNCSQGKDGKRCKNDRCYFHNVLKITEYIDRSRFAVDLCIYALTCSDLASAVVRAHERGVIVRVITDSEMVYASGTRIIEFSEMGIPVKWKKSTKLMHHKFCVIDSPLRAPKGIKNDPKVKSEVLNPSGLLMTGSMNWTFQAISGNWDNILITSQPELVALFQKEFDHLWEDFSPFVYKGHPTMQNIILAQEEASIEYYGRKPNKIKVAAKFINKENCN